MPTFTPGNRCLPMAVSVIVAAVAVVVVLAIGAWTTTVDSWYRSLRKPRWNPPDWVFGPAWTAILALAAWSGVSAWMNASSAADQHRILVLFGINVALPML